jgi:predicted glycosyltransferase
MKYDGFKELAYLHPRYFTPDVSCLSEYDLKPNGYVFIREVANTTVNYRGLEMGELSRICPHLKDAGFKIVLSLENKKLRDRFESECVILDEPVTDIYSLLHFAALTISSGDTMARESCLVGTPAIYTGGRIMPVNTELENRKCLFRVTGEQQILSTVSDILENDLKQLTEKVISEAIESEWEDTTEVIVNCLLSTIYKDDSFVQQYKVA